MAALIMRRRWIAALQSNRTGGYPVPKFARLAMSLVVVIGIGSAIALSSPGVRASASETTVAASGGCFTSSHTVTFGGYNKDTLSAQLCWNPVDSSIGNVRQSCTVIESFSNCDGYYYTISGNYSTTGAIVRGYYYGSGPDNSYEAVIWMRIYPGGSHPWGWYYIYDI
jgi:hypothetical protein